MPNKTSVTVSVVINTFPIFHISQLSLERWAAHPSVTGSIFGSRISTFEVFFARRTRIWQVMALYSRFLS